MEMTVYVEDWQLACCGKPFGVGSQVSWTLIQGGSGWLQAILGAEASCTVDAKEEHHGRLPAHVPATEGTVNRIYAVCGQYAPPAHGPGPQQPVPGSAVLIPVTETQLYGSHNCRQGKFIGYIAQIRTA